jgi:serine/threonine protein kinase
MIGQNLTGAAISHYKILERLGQGGMSVVYKALDTRLRRSVAIKILPPHLVADEKNRLRFIQEAQAASALNHPNICTVHDIDEYDGIHFMVMEFIDGETLRKTLERRGPLPVREVIDIGLKVADALKAAHAKGIIHRDIKPDNIMISKDGYVKVMDFGLAKLMAISDEPPSQAKPLSADLVPYQLLKTSVSTLQGTAAYMAPEQIENKQVDERTDIFSLGIVLYEMLSGTPPFVAFEMIALMKSILKDQPKPLSFSGLQHASASALNQVILKALAKAPASRYSGIAELGADLKRIQAKMEKKRTPRHALAIISAVALVLVLIGFLTLSFLKKRTAALPSSFKIYQVDRTPEIEAWPSFSPDGQRVLYSATERESSNLCIRNLKSGKVSVFLSKEGLMADWSPDGAKIVFLTSEGKIFVSDTLNQNPIKIADSGFAPKWSPDGRQITFCTTSPAAFGEENAIFIYNLEDRTLRQVSPENGLKFTFPDWSPDGRWVVCAGGEGSLWELWLIEAATGKAYQMSGYESWILSPVWDHSGKFIYFLSNKNGPREVWRVMVDMKNGKLKSKPLQITTRLNIRNMDVAPAGDKLILTLTKSMAQIWGIPLSKTETNPLQKAKPILSNLGWTENIEISPDGKKMVVETVRTEVYQSLILKSLTDGSETVLHEDPEWPPFAPTWSADGEWIAFDAGGGNNADIWRISAHGGRAEKLIEHTGADWMPTYSPDGKYICFLSNRSGQFDLWVQNLQTGETRQITNSPDTESRGSWSHDSKQLAFFQNSVNENNSGIWIYHFPTGKMEKLLNLPGRKIPIVNKLAWKHNDSAIYFFDYFQGSPLREVSVDNKKVNLVFEDTRTGMKLKNNAFTVIKETGYFVAMENIADLWMAEGLK